MDDAAEILSEDVPGRREELLEAMSEKDAEEVRALLGYPRESAGRLMTERLVRIRPDMTAADVIGRIHPDKGAAEAIEVAERAGMPLTIAGIVQDEVYFESSVGPHIDGERVSYVGPVGPEKCARCSRI